MRIPPLVGSPAVRLLTGVLALSTVLLSARAASGGGAAGFAALGAALLTLLGAIHSSRTFYAAWMRWAAALHQFVVKVMFTACYVLVVPIFVPIVWIRDPLRRRRGRLTTWVGKTDAPDLRSLERMG